jgi:hypothetical protein
MTSASRQLKEALSLSRLEDVRHLWFGHLPDQEHHVVPSQEGAKHWFSQNKEFDEACV